MLEADGDTKMRRRLLRGNGNMQAGTYPLPPPVLGPAAGEDWPGVGGQGQEEQEWKPLERSLPLLLRANLGLRREEGSPPHLSLHFQESGNAT